MPSKGSHTGGRQKFCVYKHPAGNYRYQLLGNEDSCLRFGQVSLALKGWPVDSWGERLGGMEGELGLCFAAICFCSESWKQDESFPNSISAFSFYWAVLGSGVQITSPRGSPQHGVTLAFIETHSRAG